MIGRQLSILRCQLSFVVTILRLGHPCRRRIRRFLHHSVLLICRDAPDLSRLPRTQCLPVQNLRFCVPPVLAVSQRRRPKGLSRLLRHPNPRFQLPVPSLLLSIIAISLQVARVLWRVLQSPNVELIITTSGRTLRRWCGTPWPRYSQVRMKRKRKGVLLIQQRHSRCPVNPRMKVLILLPCPCLHLLLPLHHALFSLTGHGSKRIPLSLLQMVISKLMCYQSSIAQMNYEMPTSRNH